MLKMIKSHHVFFDWYGYEKARSMAGDLVRLWCNSQTIALPSLCQVGGSELGLVLVSILSERSCRIDLEKDDKSG